MFLLIFILVNVYVFWVFNSCSVLLLEESSDRVDTAIWMHYLDANKTAGEEARRQLHKNVASYIE